MQNCSMVTIDQLQSYLEQENKLVRTKGFDLETKW